MTTWFVPIRAVSAQHGREPVLNPTTYTSPSGEYELHINPSSPSGAGPGEYRLRRQGEEVWSSEHPFTFWSAAVSDDGLVAGFAYSAGVVDIGQLTLAIIDTNGKLRMQQPLAQEHSRFIHAPPVPRAAGVFFQPGHDRVVFRIEDADLNRDEEQWRAFRASDGVALETVVPKREAKLEGARFISAARPLSNTDLVLVHWFVYDSNRGRLGSMGGAFALVDLEAKPVWMREFRGDYEDPGAEDSTALRDRALEHGIISVSANAFEIWSVRERQRLAFAVKRPAAPGATWEIKETGRQPYDGPADAPDAVAEIEEIKLEQLETIRIGEVEAPARAIRDVREFDIDGQGRIGFVRLENGGAEGQRSTFVLVNQRGEVLLERSPEGFGPQNWWMEQVAWAGGGKWIVTSSPLDNDALARAWSIDADTGEVHAIEKFAAPGVEALCGTGDGGFAALVRQRSQFTSTEWLAAFEAEGKERWRVESEHGHPQRLFAPQDVAAADGVVAVVSNIAHDVKLYNRDGKHLRTIDLEEAFGREPSYPTEIAPDSGGWIVHDIGGKPAVWRIAGDAARPRSFEPRFEDGRQFRLAGGVRIDPDGQLWTSDGHSLLQLNQDGIVAKVLGSPPEAHALESIGGITTDRDGRIYASDRRTGSVHVFDPKAGGRLRVMSPQPTDFKDDVFLAQIAIDAAGNVYLGDSMGVELVKFNPAGERVGRVAPTVAGFITEWLFNSTSDDQWLVRGLDSLVLVREDKEVRTIQRRPDGGWLGDIASVALGRDGGLVVTTSSNTPGAGGTGVHLYTRDGEALRSIRGPVGYQVGLAGPYAIVPVGSQVYLYPRDGGPIRRLSVTLPEGAQDYLYPLLAPNDEELWLHAAGSSEILRFRLPD